MSSKKTTQKTSQKNQDSKFIREISSLSAGRIKVTFDHPDMDPAFLNALRRMLIGELKVYSLASNLKITKNTTSFNNEFIQSRVRLVPVKFNDLNNPKSKAHQTSIRVLESKLIFRFCDPDNWEEALTNKGDLDLHLSIHMMKIFDQEGNLITDLDIKEIFPYNMEIITLRKQQQIHISAEIASGIGKNHACWKGCMVAYKFENPVSLGEKPPTTGQNPITNVNNETIPEKREFPINERQNAQIISLTLKTNGHYTPNDCIQLALDTMEEKLITLKELVDNPMLNGTSRSVRTNVEIIPHKDIENYVQIKIQDMTEHDMPLATHTLGNMIAKHMYYRLTDMIGNDLEQLRKSMTSYRQPHPLDRIIYINIKVPDNLYKDNQQKDQNLRLFDETIDHLIQNINQIREELTQ